MIATEVISFDAIIIDSKPVKVKGFSPDYLKYPKAMAEAIAINDLKHFVFNKEIEINKGIISLVKKY